MINAHVTTEWNAKPLLRATRKGSWQVLKRAAAYARGIARRMVKRRKHKSSPPGQPPYAHNTVFKASILYEVDFNNCTAYVGPRFLKEKRRNIFGQPIPHVLEFGGAVAQGPNANWWQKGRFPGIRTEKDIADFAKQRGYGPAYWGETLASIQRKMNRGGRGRKEEAHREKGGKGSNAQYQRFKRFSPIKGKRVYLASIKIKSEKAAKKVARTIVEIFGFPNTDSKLISIAPRPLMGPSLEKTKPFIYQCLKNSITKE